MADSISIVMKMNDDISGKLKSIASTGRMPWESVMPTSTSRLPKRRLRRWM